MLKDILNGHEKSSAIVISDEADSCGRTLLLNFLLESIKRDLRVIVCCIERPQQFFNSWLPSEAAHLVNYLDFTTTTDPSGSSILEDVLQAAERCKDKTCVIIDSLTVPLLVSDTPTVCRALQRIKTVDSVVQVLAILHRDVHDDQTHTLLSHQSSSVLDLRPGPNWSNTQICQVTHCRHTGKVLKSEECFKVDSSFLISDIQPAHKLSHTMHGRGDAESNQPDPTSQLTFNLSLTSNEEEARRNLVLPYLKDSRSNETSPQQGAIHYVADDADDFDEEDPDDDLNI